MKMPFFMSGAINSGREAPGAMQPSNAGRSMGPKVDGATALLKRDRPLTRYWTFTRSEAIKGSPRCAQEGALVYKYCRSCEKKTGL
jgi:hypothetical protein